MKTSIRRSEQGDSFYITVKVEANKATVTAALPDEIASHLKKVNLVGRLDTMLTPPFITIPPAQPAADDDEE